MIIDNYSVMSFLNKIFGDPNKKVLNSLQKQVEVINELEKNYQKLTDKELKEKTAEFKKKVAEAKGDWEKEKVILDELMPDAFAVVREASKRVWGERQFEVQIIGGIVLHQGKIAEMKTGEGKTIVATLPLYLNALTGRGVYLVTVNDYLSRHNGEGMGEIYNFLGLSTSVIQSNQQTFKFVKKKTYEHYSECEGENLEPIDRSEAYKCDIVYGTNNEFGFDYLRDNMAPTLDRCAQREQFYAIVDEVDSILIDEARTPLIISAPAEESGSMYQQFSSLVPRLKAEEDYVVDEKDRVVSLTSPGIKKMEQMLGIENIYEEGGMKEVHHLEQALKAHALFQKDRDYVVKDGEIVIVDEFTGRLMVGRRFSEGLHQAIEAKEGVEVKRESQTLATITFQNLFRMYTKLAGMTGTALTEAEEFFKIYNLDVVEIPTNVSVIRDDRSDKIYKTSEAKWQAIVKDVKAMQQKGQPVLVGTVSVEKNEMLSKMFKKAGIKHAVLNAKHHDKEAKIITKAGKKGAVTVATNMAGRGTDIKLDEETRGLGGLYVIGTERHEARRIDNQLRGRSGRQGDKGASQFYISLGDDLMRIFGGERLKETMDKLGLPDDIPIENGMISRSIEGAQKKVEGHNFDIRKHVVEYDDVMNKHREVIYRKRRKILEAYKEDSGEKSREIRDEIVNILKDEVTATFAQFSGDDKKIELELQSIFGELKTGELDQEKVIKKIDEIYKEREKNYGEKVARDVERAVYLRTIDMLWVEHLTTMNELRQGIGLRGYGQQDPLVEYKAEAYKMFETLLAQIEYRVARTIFKVQVQVKPTAPIRRQPLEYDAPDPNDVGGLEDEEREISQERDQSQETKNKQISRPKADQPMAENSQYQNGVTTSIRTSGKAEKSVYDRMMNLAGNQGTVKSNKKVGRNDPCPCGSGKKYKKCCGR